MITSYGEIKKFNYKYSTEKVIDKLEISNTTLQEIKKKLKIEGFITEREFLKIKEFANEVLELYGKVTVSTVNKYVRKDFV